MPMASQWNLAWKYWTEVVEGMDGRPTSIVKFYEIFRILLIEAYASMSLEDYTSPYTAKRLKLALHLLRYCARTHTETYIYI